MKYKKSGCQSYDYLADFEFIHAQALCMLQLGNHSKHFRSVLKQ